MLSDLLEGFKPRATVEDVLAKEDPAAIADLHTLIRAGALGYQRLRDQILSPIFEARGMTGELPTRHACEEYIKEVKKNA